MKPSYWSKAIVEGGIAAFVVMMLLAVPACCLTIVPAGKLGGIIIVPLAGLVFGLITMRGSWLRQLERDRRLAGLCVKCGYDIRAATDRCPECGRRIFRPAPNPPPQASHTEG